MSLLSRLKDRVETDLPDLELQTMLDEATGEITRRFGAIAAITEHHDGSRRYLNLHRAIDEGEAITVVEIDPANTGAAANETTLAADDYRVIDGGLTVERLIDGTNGRSYWGPLVRLTYTPVSNQPQRDEVAIKVAQVALVERGLASFRAGDYSETYRDAPKERERLIASLAPLGRGLMA